MKIAICDDVSAIADKIEDILENYCDLNKLDLDILQFTDTESVKEYLLNGNSIDLIFLDIEFPDKSGIDLENFIRNIREDYATEIIFISGSDKYFRDLLEFQPITFISKPFMDLEIIEGFEIFLKRLNLLNLKFSYKKNGYTYLIPYNDILYFESNGKGINIYSENVFDSFYGSILELDMDINYNSFIRIHKSYVVNIDKVTSVKKDVLILTNGVQLPIGRMYEDELKKYIMGMKQNV